MRLFLFGSLLCSRELPPPPSCLLRVTFCRAPLFKPCPLLRSRWRQTCLMMPTEWVTSRCYLWPTSLHRRPVQLQRSVVRVRFSLELVLLTRLVACSASSHKHPSPLTPSPNHNNHHVPRPFPFNPAGAFVSASTEAAAGPVAIPCSFCADTAAVYRGTGTIHGRRAAGSRSRNNGVLTAGHGYRRFPRAVGDRDAGQTGAGAEQPVE